MPARGVASNPVGIGASSRARVRAARMRAGVTRAKVEGSRSGTCTSIVAVATPPVSSTGAATLRTSRLSSRSLVAKAVQPGVYHRAVKLATTGRGVLGEAGQSAGGKSLHHHGGCVCQQRLAQRGGVHRQAGSVRERGAGHQVRCLLDVCDVPVLEHPEPHRQLKRRGQVLQRQWAPNIQRGRIRSEGQPAQRGPRPVPPVGRALHDRRGRQVVEQPVGRRYGQTGVGGKGGQGVLATGGQRQQDRCGLATDLQPRPSRIARHFLFSFRSARHMPVSRSR
jgi:hypothetical protein